MSNSIIISELSENTVDALLAWKAGDEEFSFDMLTLSELYDLDRVLGDEVDLSLWINSKRLELARIATRRSIEGPDFEGAILAADERWDPCSC